MSETNAPSAEKKRRPTLLYVVLGLVVLTGAGYGAMSCQTVRSSLVSAADTEYKAPASDPVRAKGAPQITFETVVDGVDNPTDLRFFPGHPDTLIVLSKNGTATWHKLDAKKTSGTFFKSKVRNKSELGLLGIAFHPKFKSNGRFFVNETPKDGAMRTRIAEYNADPTNPTAGATFTRSILEVKQPYPNHDAGQLLFGNDGFLYIGMGDGGWRADPEGNGQNLATLLGSILRIDIDGTSDGRAYKIPKDNPFVAKEGARGEIYAYGIRNPWRFTFADDGRLIVADVGQDKFEEVTIVSKGENHGWNTKESAHCFSPATDCKSDGLVDPVFEYDHSIGSSITGGVIYRGTKLPSLAGKYLFADFIRGHLWSMSVPSPADAKKGVNPKLATRLGSFPALWSAFTNAPDGEVLIADFSGKIVRIVPKSAPSTP